MSKSYKNYKPKQPITQTFQVPASSESLQRPQMGPWDLTKLDNLHFSWDGPLSFNKT